MPIVDNCRVAEGIATKASTRAVTRNTMLNTISDRVQQSQEQHEALAHNVVLQQDSPSVLRSHGKEPYKVSKGKEIPLLEENLRRLPNHKYEIPTLIELGKDARESSKVLLKIRPEAIAGKSHIAHVVPPGLVDSPQ